MILAIFLHTARSSTPPRPSLSPGIPHRYRPGGTRVGDFVFCDQSLGSLHLDALSMGPSLSRYGAHADGTSGVDFDFRTKAYAQAFRYTYNATPVLPDTGILTLSGIHLIGAATGAADDPADPATWEFAGSDNVFRIGSTNSGASTWGTTTGGDIDAGYNPAKIDVGTDGTRGSPRCFSTCPCREACGWKT